MSFRCLPPCSPASRAVPLGLPRVAFLQPQLPRGGRSVKKGMQLGFLPSRSFCLLGSGEVQKAGRRVPGPAGAQDRAIFPAREDQRSLRGGRPPGRHHDDGAGIHGGDRRPLGSRRSRPLTVETRSRPLFVMGHYSLHCRTLSVPGLSLLDARRIPSPTSTCR